MGISAGISLLLLVLSWLLASWACPRLRSLWLERVGLHGEGLGERMGPILRSGVASLLLALAANMWLWHDHAALILGAVLRSEEHTSELQSLMRISYAVFCLKKKTK